MPRRFYLLLTLATLAGAFLRLWQLTAVPPGLHYDLAATALLGNEVAFNGLRPVFITAFTGHEVLFYYWLALWFRLIGSSIFSLRLAAALIGVLTIPAAFFAIREALRFEAHSFAIAAFGTAFLSFAFFHVAFSRFGFRVITEPLIQSLALGFLFRGLHRLSVARSGRPSSIVGHPTSDVGPRTSDFGLGALDLGLSGAFTGLAAYTYLAARFLPIPLAVFWFALLIGATIRRAQRSSVVRPHLSFAISSFFVFFLTALLTFMPLGLYFLQHPEDFLNRASQIAPRPGEAALVLQGLRKAAEMIFISGEPYDRYNLPGLPLFGPVLGFIFVIGLLITLRNLLPLSRREPGEGGGGWGPLRWATELLLLAWLPAMLLPAALAVHEITPSNIRAFGVAPLLFAFPARGLIASARLANDFVNRLDLTKSVRRLFRPLTSDLLLPASFFLVLSLGTLATAYNYFVVWANLPNQRLNNDADLTAIAAYLNAQDLTDTAVFVSAIHYRHPTLAYLAQSFNDIRWLTGGASLAIPGNQNALYVFARSAPPPEEWIAQWSTYLVAAPAVNGVPDFRAYRFAAGETPPLPDFAPLSENFGNFATLTGYRLGAGAQPGTGVQPNALTVDLRWHIENIPAADDFLPYARLYDAWGSLWSQSGGFTYPSSQWAPGDTLLTRMNVPLPAGLPPGQYTLKAGLYSANTDSGLPRLNAEGGYAGDRAPLSTVDLAGGPAADVSQSPALGPLSAPVRVAGFDRDLTLTGYTLTPASARQGERLNLTLFWSARAPLADTSVTITLGGTTLFSGQPVHDTFPFSAWAAGQVVADRYSLKVPADFPPGSTDLSVNAPGYGSATLTPLEVMLVDHIYTEPQPALAAGYRFGNEIALHSYGLEPGSTTVLTLFWQSLAATDSDYTVFVHVLSADGQIVAQSDSLPRGGSYPTSMWVPGEFVTDPFLFDLPSGAYTVEVGLFTPETGERLSVTDSTGKLLGDVVALSTFRVP